MIGNRLDNVESYRAHTIKYDNIWVNIWDKIEVAGRTTDFSICLVYV
jgi:hypothetical protein